MPRNGRKKVLFAIESLGGGGAERVFVSLLEQLNRKIVEPGCVFNTSNHVFRIPRGVKSFVLGMGEARETIFKLNRIIRQESPGAILSFVGPMNIEVILASALSKHRHTLIISEQSTPSARTFSKGDTLERALIKKFYPWANRIIAVCRGVKEDLVRNFNLSPRKIRVIHNGIDIEGVKRQSHEPVTEHPWFREKVPILINVASLRAIKGQQYLLRAFEKVRRRVECRLVILGQGEKEKELKNLAKSLGVSRDVAFLGFQENPFKFMKGASVFVLSSLCEGLPLVLLEAMAVGTPVISTDCPSGPREIIKHSQNGLLVPARDVTSLARAMMQVLTHERLARHVASRAGHDVWNYSIERTAEKYMSLFKN